MSDATDFPSASAVETVLQRAFPEALTLRVQDDSHLHAGHAGASAGRHFSALIVSERFATLTRVGRHRLVYDSLAQWMHRGIHALALQTLTPAEADVEANGSR